MVSCKAPLIAMAIVVAALLPATTSAFPNNHLVGDLKIWALNVNYDDWANSVSVIEGDTLEFTYFPGHNVLMVNEDDYNACVVTNPERTWDSGNDYVQVPEARKYFFICGMPDHCTEGMKLAINVEPKSDGY